MDDSFFSYLERLELIAFFAGYPLVWLLALSIAGKKETRTPWKRRLVKILPYAYALVGVLYWGMQLRHDTADFTQSTLLFLKIWALSSLLFFIPLFSRNPVPAFLHSLVFFYLPLKDIYIQATTPGSGPEIVRNDMNVYTDSLLLVSLVVVSLFTLHSIYSYYRSKQKPGQSDPKTPGI
jgi:hypothetical protein